MRNRLELGKHFGRTCPIPIKTTLQDIIRIISTVMQADDATPSTRQAAVECVEQWVKLPGVGLHQWTPVLSVVFGAVSEDR